MQQRRVIWMAALALGWLGTGCGDDAGGGGEGSSSDADGGGGSGGGERRDASTSSGSGDSGMGSGSGTGGEDPGDDPVDPGQDPMMSGSDEDAGLMEDCGTIACEVGMCCADPFSSMCGAPIGERGCIMPPPPDASSDERCPPLNIMGFFMLPSCCTPEGQCGINAMQFGAGCIELGEFAMLAQQMAGGSGIMLTVPPPQPCD